ncbi:hypothetical protein HUA74_24375 [Myxococcus sp. CA051A]|uniref:hypothetical protein n=1 Tax=unclassified Myxococcus TaxID=2648731 RepID=UPI00157A8092|nr:MULTISPECIES: hypothetical protein [unclassified Myxococcus]NTX15068.1 hypothetical protein [Myxococcus sp. CA056]NTX36071.1 hypothetical protein [Myxococcus sp. CA033]NTX55021.1 hypothetical protein [Myxococcus sp. CA039A]NTX63799.1 hypothetical protein [Myxococcus sp. CA051A]
MTLSLKKLVLMLPVLAVASGCNLFDTADTEGTRGRGARAFDPYDSSASGAISLSLLWFKGCAILPTGEPVTKGDLNLPAYGDTCYNMNDGYPRPDAPFEPSEPHARMVVSAGELYFLREFSAMDVELARFPEYNDKRTPAAWMRLESYFKDLDWSGLSSGRDGWKRLQPQTFLRETFYENAAWMLATDDTFLLEVLDADGNVRVSQTYLRSDFLAESPVTGRTRASFTVTGLQRPLFPGDPTPHRAANYDALEFATAVKVSFANSTNPFKSFTMPDLRGEGVIRFTWSQLPQKPFLFPVTFQDAKERPPTCYELGPDGLATDVPTPCGFGLKQKVQVSRPPNGNFFNGGETVDFVVSLQDGDGHGLHPRGSMPSFMTYMEEGSNGLAYFNEFMLLTWRDSSASESGFKVVGPLQDLKVVNGGFVPTDYFSYPASSEPQFYVPPDIMAVAGGPWVQPTTRYTVTLPPDAKPGTYAILLKGHRNFEGERLNRLDPFFFQVGQAEPTTYPGRIGNCQVCHNGVSSLSNVHHGVSVDHVETCKVCHHDDVVGHVSDFVHRLHINSPKYVQNKGDCTLCHLTRESTLRPSMIACAGCHPGTHGTEYFDLPFQEINSPPNAFGNCANACHVTTAPAEHVLPVR